MAPTSTDRPADGADRPGGTDSRGTSRTSRTFSEGSSAPVERSRPAGGVGSAGASRPVSAPARGGRRIRLTLARLDPFSVMKLSFLLAVGIGIATVVCVALLWNIVDAIGLWDKITSMVTDMNNNKPAPFMEFFTFSKMVSYATVIAVVNIVIITALGTLFAFLYNIVASLLGGLKMTFTDD